MERKFTKQTNMYIYHKRKWRNEDDHNDDDDY